jgi:hypothetical protein
VLWVDKNIVEKYRNSWTPVSHPLLLSGRSVPLTADCDNKGVGGGVRGGGGGGQHTQAQADSVSTNLKRSLDATENTAKERERQTEKEKEKEKESRMSSSAIDDVKMRFLARKKAKTAGTS